MKKEKMTLKIIWNKTKFLIIILTVWLLLNNIFALDDILGRTVFSIISWTVTIGVFGYLGYILKKEKKSERTVLKYGAFLGAVTGFIGAIISIITFHIFPERMTEIVAQAVAQGANKRMALTIANISVYSGLVISPLISGVFGAVISWISAFAFRKKI